MSGFSAAWLDREIALQTATKTQDANTGEEIVAWPVTERLWAQWLPGSTREAWQAQQRLESYIDGVFRIWWRGDIGPETHRIVWNGTVFDVKPPIEVGRREGLEIPVVARTT